MNQSDQQPEKIADQVRNGSADGGGHPPVEKWNPEFSGDLAMVIQRDGQWCFRGRPLARPELVRLFSTILRRDDDGDYYLVTPVEKWRIQVEDVPFVAHSVTTEGEGESQVIWLETNVGETLAISAAHPLRIEQSGEQPAPYVRVRRNLEARVERAAFYHLVDLAVERDQDGRHELGVWSRGHFWPLGEL